MNPMLAALRTLALALLPTEAPEKTTHSFGERKFKKKNPRTLLSSFLSSGLVSVSDDQRKNLHLSQQRKRERERRAEEREGGKMGWNGRIGMG